MMKPSFYMFFLSVLGLLGLSGNAGAQGLTSGDFESGLQVSTGSPAVVTGWFPFGTGVAQTLQTTGAHGGTNCGKVTVAAGSSGFVQQKIWGPMQCKGQNLIFSGWVKTTWGTGGAQNLWLTKGTKTGTTFADLLDITAKTTGELAQWTYLAGAFTVNVGPDTPATAGTTSSFLSPRLSIDATGSTTDNTIYMDDFKLENYTPDHTNLLVNPSFELGLGNWQQWPVSGFTPSTVTTNVKDGAMAVKVVYPAGSQGYLYQYYSGNKFYKGSQLKFSAWYKANFASDGGWVSLYRDIAVNDAWGNYFDNIGFMTGNQPVWTKLEMDLVMPDAAAPDKGVTALTSNYLALRLAGDAETVTGGDSTVYWDDVQLKTPPNAATAWELF